jgi:hypothetical protein
MNPEILTFLVHGAKISMPDRIEPGLWPHPPITLSEVEQHLAGMSGHQRRFPHEWQDHKQSPAVYEGGMIERKGRSKYIYRRDLDGWRVIG